MLTAFSSSGIERTIKDYQIVCMFASIPGGKQQVACHAHNLTGKGSDCLGYIRSLSDFNIMLVG